MAPELAAPLVPQPRPVKPRLWFGYLPLWQECFPLNPETGKVDSVRTLANIMAGCIIGIRQTLSAIVSATLVFTTTSDVTVASMFPFGISMMWWSTAFGSLFYGLFGRLQYNTNATQEVCAILYGAMAGKAAKSLSDRPEQIPATVVALIVVGTVFTGIGSMLFGKLGVGRLMLSFPTPVTNGFLGTIGFFLVVQALKITTGVPFTYFYPRSLSQVLEPRSLCPTICLFAMVMFMRSGPGLLKQLFPRSAVVKKLGGLICQLLPLFLFFAVVATLGVDRDRVSELGWTYPAQAPESFTTLWTKYPLSDADWWVVLGSIPDMFSLVLMSILCTMTGVLGITGKFPGGPDGDPAPDDVIDFDGELATVGMGAILSGLTNGVVTFHRLGSSVQLRMDGGTHRVAVLSSSLFVAVFFFSSLPLGHYIPKFFLGGLFCGSGIGFLEAVFFSYRSMPASKLKLFGKNPPTAQYYVALSCIIVAAFSSPFEGIGVGLMLTLFLFLMQSARTHPVSSVSDGRNTMSRTLRPHWELKHLRADGDRIAVFYLQGQLFFGSGQSLASDIARAIEARPSLAYIVLSFAKVPSIDVSAVDFLKGALKKASKRGCKIMFCRMQPSIFASLSAAELISSPDADLRNVLDALEEESEDAPQRTPTLPVVESSEHPAADIYHAMRRESSFRPLRLGNHDAFDHETDALDWCADRLLGETYYKRGDLDESQREYRTCCEMGIRLTDETFEKMNMLPPGTMAQLKEHCTLKECPSRTVLREANALYFVLKGAVSMVDVAESLPESVSHIASSASLADFLKVGKKGFHGRGGKRLRKRYPPGSIVGKTAFCLHRADRLLDEHVMSELIVSGKFGKATEVWILPGSKWDSLPAGLKSSLNDMLVMQQAEERQHTFLCGE